MDAKAKEKTEPAFSMVSEVPVKVMEPKDKVATLAMTSTLSDEPEPDAVRASDSGPEKVEASVCAMGDLEFALNLPAAVMVKPALTAPPGKEATTGVL